MPLQLKAQLQFAAEMELPPSLDVQSCIQTAADAAGSSGAKAGEVVVRFVDVDEGRALNEAYGGKPKATNVLAFPADARLAVSDEPDELGDIVICLPVVAQEAVAQSKDMAAHLSHLVVHGTLHLLGFRHDNDAEAEQMEALETRVLSTLGYADPYGFNG